MMPGGGALCDNTGAGRAVSDVTARGAAAPFSQVTMLMATKPTATRASMAFWNGVNTKHLRGDLLSDLVARDERLRRGARRVVSIAHGMTYREDACDAPTTT